MPTSRLFQELQIYLFKDHFAAHGVVQTKTIIMILAEVVTGNSAARWAKLLEYGFHLEKYGREISTLIHFN